MRLPQLDLTLAKQNLASEIQAAKSRLAQLEKSETLLNDGGEDILAAIDLIRQFGSLSRVPTEGTPTFDPKGLMAPNIVAALAELGRPAKKPEISAVLKAHQCKPLASSSLTAAKAAGMVVKLAGRLWALPSSKNGAAKAAEALNGHLKRPLGRGKLSAAGRQAISTAMKARWAAVKRTHKPMSAARRRAVGLRMKKYWAARRKAEA